MAKPDYLHPTAIMISIGALLGIVSSGTGLLGSPLILSSGLLSWPGWDLPLTLAGFVGSAIGLATVTGLLALKPWAPKVGAVLGVLTILTGLVTLLVLAPIKGFVFPWVQVVEWSVVIVAGIWVVGWCTHPDVADAYAEEAVFPSTRPAPAEAEPEAE